MHGRVKVKTTLEQQEAKRKEREKKLQLYVSTTQAAFNKRKSGQLDKEALELTSQILALNPDFASLWNLRREVFLALGNEWSEEEMRTLYVGELSFLENCLRVNPKSYGTWYHRCWVMQHMPEPDWARELHLCNRFLEIDERNFHCWDYRRFVTQSSQVPDTDELELTSNLITKNFSNYSSWHYRSKLLPRIHPDPERHGRLTEEALLSELELVQNAFFTDPNDQSAWFYHRWLLGRGDHPLSIRCILANMEIPFVTVTFSHPVFIFGTYDYNLSPWRHLKGGRCLRSCEITDEISQQYSADDMVENDLILFIDERPVMVTWKTPEGKEKPSLVWVCDVPKKHLTYNCQHTFKVIWKDDEIKKECALYPGKKVTWHRDSVTEANIFSLELSEGKSNVLQQELQSCKELQELEPENKWCLLTIILLMRALDPLLYEKETLHYFDTLKAADPMRSGYYDDLRSKFQIENAILKMEYAESNVVIVLDKGLTRLCLLEHLVLISHMCLSNNRLRYLPRDVSMLLCVQVLEVDNNEISHLEGVWNLPSLEELSLQCNKISKVEDLQPLVTCPRLSVLRLQGNPLCEIADIKDQLKAFLPHVDTIEI